MSNYRRRTSPRRSRPLSYKSKVIKSVHTVGVSKTLRRLNVTKDQVKSWMRKEEEIMQAERESRSSKEGYEEVQEEEKEVGKWVRDRLRMEQTVYNEDVLTHAYILFSQTAHQAKATRRWLFSFKRRFQLFDITDRPKRPQVLSVPKPLPASLPIPLPPRDIIPLDDLDSRGEVIDLETDM